MSVPLWIRMWGWRRAEKRLAERNSGVLQHQHGHLGEAVRLSVTAVCGVWMPGTRVAGTK